MLFSALLSFFGGSAFRMIWGEVSHWLTEKQNHSFEIERLKLQGELDAAEHARNMESIKVQAELGVKTIQVQAQADLDRIEGSAWEKLVDSTTHLTGITFIDIWNGVIRPLLATLAIMVVIGEIIQNGFVLSDWDRELVAAILGIYVADRSLAHRGK
ncbi:MAG TPA: hypothetical protein VFM48_15440 [Aquabacterium sp.]|nr:hypothetical protein [Aquabacterium sp.]